MTTKRKPYVRPMTSTWWKKLPFYRFYIVREGTAVPTVWFSIVLIYGLFALKHGAESRQRHHQRRKNGARAGH